jgi:protein-S-isoprenylcysteine O-methyltransferase Ste14
MIAHHGDAETAAPRAGHSHHILPLALSVLPHQARGNASACTGSAILKFKGVGTTVRPDRAASVLVVVGPYRSNPMYLGLALVYVGIAIADQSVWALVLLPVVLTIIQRRAIEPEEAFLERRFGANYVRYKENVGRWI